MKMTTFTPLVIICFLSHNSRITSAECRFPHPSNNEICMVPFTEAKTFSEARQRCIMSGGNLLATHTERIVTSAHAVYREIDKTIFIGAMKDNRGIYRWALDDSKLTLGTFVQGPPGKDCIVAKPPDWSWSTVNCRQSYPFICQLPDDFIPTSNSVSTAVDILGGDSIFSSTLANYPVEIVGSFNVLSTAYEILATSPLLTLSLPESSRSLDGGTVSSIQPSSVFFSSPQVPRQTNISTPAMYSQKTVIPPDTLEHVLTSSLYDMTVFSSYTSAMVRAELALNDFSSPMQFVSRTAVSRVQFWGISQATAQTYFETSSLISLTSTLDQSIVFNPTSGSDSISSSYGTARWNRNENKECPPCHCHQISYYSNFNIASDVKMKVYTPRMSARYSTKTRPDNRISSTSLGVTALLTIVSVLVLVVISDILTFVGQQNPYHQKTLYSLHDNS